MIFINSILSIIIITAISIIPLSLPPPSALLLLVFSFHCYYSHRHANCHSRNYESQHRNYPHHHSYPDFIAIPFSISIARIVNNTSNHDYDKLVWSVPPSPLTIIASTNNTTATTTKWWPSMTSIQRLLLTQTWLLLPQSSWP